MSLFKLYVLIALFIFHVQGADTPQQFLQTGRSDGETETILRTSATDDLIYTDFEGSSHLNSNSPPRSPDIEVFDGDNDDHHVTVHMISSICSSSNNDLLHLDAFGEQESTQQGASSPAQPSSLVSNVFIQDVLSVTSDTLQPRTEPQILANTTSTIESPYPIRRALLRRKNKIKPIIAQRKPKPQRKHRKSTSARKPSHPAGGAISLEAVAGRTEDTYFALSLVGSLERLSARKRATAKLHILQYLTELAFAED